jgi:hypothetical protein
MLRRLLDVFIGEESDDFGNERVYRILDSQGVMRPAPEGDHAEPTIRLRESQALALLTALQRHFEGGEQVARLRKDYDAERARVDKLTDAVLEIAKKGPVFINEH